METFFGGLALAFISSVSWIAYKHPQAYKRLGLFLFAGLILSYSVYFGWISGVRYGRSLGAEVQFDDLAMPVFLCFIAASLYLTFLLALPHLFDGNDRDQ